MGEKDGKYVMVDGTMVWVPNQTTDYTDVVDFIIKEEGFNPYPKDIGDGKITLGSGLTDPKWHELYRKRGNVWSAEDNRRAVESEVRARENWLQQNFPNWNKLPRKSQEALISYRYNYNFTPKNSPKLFEAARNNDFYRIASEMDATSSDPKFKEGLKQRRLREQEYFKQGASQRMETPKAAVPPPVQLVERPDATRVYRPEYIPKQPYTPKPMHPVQENFWNEWSRMPYKAEGGELNTRKKWEDLTLGEKAEMMKVAIRNGITTLPEIRMKYNEFAEGGDLTDQEYYTLMEKVAKENNPIWNKLRVEEGGKPLTVDEEYARILNDNTYNYRDYYRKYPQSRANADTHWTDEFKTVWHPSFSNQSVYSGKKSQYNPYGLEGGFWIGEQFVPKIWQAAEENKNLFKKGGSTIPSLGKIYTDVLTKAVMKDAELKMKKKKEEKAAKTYKVPAAPAGGYVYDVLPGLFAKDGVPITVTSGLRKGAIVQGTNRMSRHALGQAADIVGDFAAIRRVLDDPNSHVSQWMLANGYGYLDETSKTGTTKYWHDHNRDHSHYHIGADFGKRYADVLGGKYVPVPGGGYAPAGNAPMPGNAPVYDSILSFEPLNPDAFGSPIATYTPPEIEMPVVEPLVAAADQYSQAALEAEQRRNNLNTLGWLLSMGNTSGSNDSLINTLGMLTRMSS